MNYFYIEPEVAGGLGGQTVIDTNQTPPRVTRLHYRFEGWLGDEVLESFPCFIVTTGLADAIATSQLTGVIFDEVITDVSDSFRELYPQRRLPPFVWIKVTGRERQDDFFLEPDGRLVVSKRVLEAVAPRAPNCKVSEFPG